MGALGRLLGAEDDLTVVLSEVDAIVGVITTVIFALAGAGLTFFAIYVGFKMAKAEDDGKRKEAKTQLIYSIIGLISAVAIIVMFDLVLPGVADLTAQVRSNGSNQGVATLATSVLTSIKLVMNTVLKIIATLAAVFALWIGWQLMKAEDDGKRKQAKTQLIYAVVGVIGVVLINLIGTSALGMLNPGD